MFGWLRGKKQPATPSEFWGWFSNNEDLLFNMEKDPRSFFDQVGKAMARVAPGVVTEFSRINPDGKRELTLSTDGDSTRIAAVESLYATAPPLRRWTVVKFKQPTPGGVLKIGPHALSAKTLNAALMTDNDGELGVVVFVQAHDTATRNALWGPITLLLESEIGEWRMLSLSGRIALEDDARTSEYDTFPMSELGVQLSRVSAM